MNSGQRFFVRMFGQQPILQQPPFHHQSRLRTLSAMRTAATSSAWCGRGARRLLLPAKTVKTMQGNTAACRTASSTLKLTGHTTDSFPSFHSSRDSNNDYLPSLAASSFKVY